MSAPQTLSTFARPQVKALLTVGERVFLASEIGLYELAGHALQTLAPWAGQPVQCIAEAPDGFLLLIENEQGQVLHRCDASWQSREVLPNIIGEKIKSLCAVPRGVLAGTKTGLFRLTDDGWQRLFADAHGQGEVLWVRSTDGLRIMASVKKLGAGARPALIESTDGGQSWAVTPSMDYQDIVLAADEQWIVTRWRGARRRGAHGEVKKHPLSAAQLFAGGWSVLDGDKLETQREGQASQSFYHPVIAEAERLCWLHDRVLVAGVQGAWLLDPASGSASDLFAGHALPEGLGKVKRVFVLDDGALLATATFGSFRSTDGGAQWQPVQAEWSVLDAEQLLRGPDGRWWLVCQRALFCSADNGLSWRYVKLKVKQQHYSELRGGIAIVAGRLYVGTKNGLLESALARPEDVRYVQAFDGMAIEALHAATAADELIVGTGDGAVWRFTTGEGQAQRLADVPVYESALAGSAAHCVLVSGDRVFELGTGTPLRDITPAGPRSEFGMARIDDRGFVLWNHTQAWRGSVGGALQPLRNWPTGIRHASVSASGRVVHSTDRRTLRQHELTGEQA